MDGRTMWALCVHAQHGEFLEATHVLPCRFILGIVWETEREGESRQTHMASNAFLCIPCPTARMPASVRFTNKIEKPRFDQYSGVAMEGIVATAGGGRRRGCVTALLVCRGATTTNTLQATSDKRHSPCLTTRVKLE